jgi:hypothetical protein
MGFVIQLASWALWFPLEILGITAILRAGVRRYPLIFTFMVATFLFAAAQAPISLAFYRSDSKLGAWLQTLNAAGESITYTLILSVVISLIYRATSGSASRRLLRTTLIGAGILAMAVSFAIHYDARAEAGMWITAWARDAHFCAAILDLALWGLLLASSERDPLLLLLTGGMGIMFAGEAIGAAIRAVAILYRSGPLFYTGHFFRVLTDSLFLFVWWQAFRRESIRQKAARAAT